MSEDNKKEVKEQNNEEINILKPNFFKKVWYSITKIEKYPEMAAQGLGNAIKYIAKLVVILAIILGLGINAFTILIAVLAILNPVKLKAVSSFLIQHISKFKILGFLKNKEEKIYKN